MRNVSLISRVAVRSRPKLVADDPAAPGRVGDRSTIAFPYTDLDNAIEVTRGVNQADGSACEYGKLAAHFATDRKTFSMRVVGARIFGLINYARSGRITLTEMGRKIVDPDREAAARADAFLRVPLYAMVFAEFNGARLPPPANLERSLVQFGVGPKVADRARQVLIRSARQAGYFEVSQACLFAPPIRTDSRRRELPEAPLENKGGLAEGASEDLHPLIDRLLLTLPRQAGRWTLTERLKWLNVANSIFSVIYRSPEEGDVEITIKGLDRRLRARS